VAIDTHAAPHNSHGAADLAHGMEDGHHGVLQHQFDDLEQQRESFNLGMWLFLATEVMMFGGLFFAYTLYRWKNPVAFEVGASHLNHLVGTANTFVLLFSSWTMALAVHAAAERKARSLVFYLGITFLLGAVFLGVKGYEWYVDFQEGLIPGVNWTYYANPQHAHELVTKNILPNNVLMYFVIYFMMTGLHAIHMIIGLGLVGTFMWMGARGKFTNGNDQPVEILGLYWHLVDIVWVFLFPLLYLIGGLQLFKTGGH